ncbi:MAG: magnesium/cobalt transporter CorA [bacterium]|nr:magnesium/cobalt transporter CorA [bacterium]MDT8365179.1 magnesium/cobalt transporter CorA [bacterium]
MGNHRKTGQRKRGVFRRQTLPGAVPGTLEVDPGAPFSKIHIIGCSPEEMEEKEIAESTELSAFMKAWPLTWVNVDGLGDSATLLELAEIFQIHKLALEDVVHVHQRSKVDVYDNNLFVVARMASVLNGALETEQLSIFLGDGFIVTFQEREGDCLDPVRDRIRKGKGRIRRSGADYLAYAILDAVIDGWFPVLEDYGEKLEALEDSILEKPDSQTVSSIHRVKRDLLEIRRTVWPTRETVNSLMRETDFIQPETNLYLRDCYDHVIQIIDMVESYRDMASGLMEFYLSSVSNRMNEIMKVLTIIATIFIPLTFFAGIYGMNFNPDASPWNMPELNWKYGYLFFWAIIAVLGVTMLLFFRRMGWLGSKGEKRESDL